MHSLEDAVTMLKGVGSKRAAQLASLGIETVGDLLSHYPFRYDDMNQTDLAELQEDARVVLKAEVVSEVVVQYYAAGKNRLFVRVKQGERVIGVTFFNQAFLKSQLSLHSEVVIVGKWEAKRQQISGQKIIDPSELVDQTLLPIYHLTKGISQGVLTALIKQAFTTYEELLVEWIPSELCQKYQLMDRQQAMYTMHFPKNQTTFKQARRRIVFAEFFQFQLSMLAVRAKEKDQENGQSLLYDVTELKRFTQQLPFELTEAQKRVTNEICRDLRSTSKMYRLLQGDVGSGKTVVAAIVLYAAFLAGYQGTLMVPTELLAEQHLVSLATLLAETEATVAILTSSTSKANRQRILEELADGRLAILVGTHALLQPDVQFNRLGLVITDEQHRFGVKQRQTLRQKGENPNVLFMTATPIPRTLAITNYGDMDVSVIDQLPAGRKPIETRWVHAAQRSILREKIAEQLSIGAQVYVVCPLIAESESLDVQNAEAIYQQLVQEFVPQYQVGLLHGKMKSDEKESIMQQFTENKLQILVSTTVIEVGVNVPNATLMIVINADRFGLAQLHQLRGRVGRGERAAACYLVADPKTPVGKERMKIMTETNDGFVLSQRDLEMRGPGEFLGKRQSGVPSFAVGDIVQDYASLATARAEALAIWAQPNWQSKPQYQTLAQHLATLTHRIELD